MPCARILSVLSPCVMRGHFNTNPYRRAVRVNLEPASISMRLPPSVSVYLFRAASVGQRPRFILLNLRLIVYGRQTFPELSVMVPLSVAAADYCQSKFRPES